MRIHNLFFLFFTVLTINVLGQTNSSAYAGSRSNSMGGVATAFRDVNALFGNQSGLVDVENLSGMVTAESRFQGTGIKTFGAGVAYPTETGTFGVTLNYFGINAYNEQQIGLAFAKKIFKNLSVGVKFDYLKINIEGYGQKGFVTGEAGLQANITGKIIFGVHLRNPYRIETTENDYLPTVLRAGGVWNAAKKTKLFAEIVKDIDYPASFRGGLEYRLLDQLSLRMGVQTAPVLVNFGIGLTLKEHFGIDIGVGYHQFLGFTPNISVVF